MALQVASTQPSSEASGYHYFLYYMYCERLAFLTCYLITEAKKKYLLNNQLSETVATGSFLRLRLNTK